LLEQQLQRAPRTLIVSPIGGRGWSSAQWLTYLQGRATAEELTRPQGPADSTLSAAGLVTRFQVERPGGRGYLVWQLPVGGSPSP